MSENEKKYEVVSGDGSDLDISPVYEHLNVGRPKCNDKKKKNIVIPKEKKTDSKTDETKDNECNDDNENNQ